MSEENDENRKNPKFSSRNRTRDTVPDFRAQYQLIYEHMTKMEFTMYINWILEKLVPRTKRNQRKVLRSACRAAGARCAPCGRRCAAGDAWRVGCWCADCLRCAGRCARAGCIRAVRCAVQDAMQYAALHGMRCASRCDANWLRCNALRCDARDADCLRYNAMHAGWLHSRCRLAFDGGILRVLRLKPKVKTFQVL